MGVLRMVTVLGLTVLAACGSDEPGSAPAGSSPAPLAEAADDDDDDDEVGDLDGLAVQLEFEEATVASGGELLSRLVVENGSADVVVDRGCRLGTGAYALIPANDPGAEAWVRPIADCGGNFVMAPGFVNRYDGPRFEAVTRFGEPLPPGDYLAVLEIDGLSERLSYSVAVTEPGA